MSKLKKMAIVVLIIAAAWFIVFKGGVGLLIGFLIFSVAALLAKEKDEEVYDFF